jgi:cytochrome c5
VKAREREEYLREYSILKGQGKPFFPYAVAKDGAMAAIVLVVIILMAVLFGAELGPKADPTTTTYSPRPEWYFFFLFELLRVVKPPALTFIATIGIPTICMVLLFLLPFYDRSAERHPLRRPVAMMAAAATVAAMAYLTVLGAVAGPPSEIDLSVAPQYEEGKDVMASSGCLGCHKIGENGNTIGPNLTEIGDRLGKDAIARTLVNPTKPMPSYVSLRENNPEQFNELVDFVASLKKDMPKDEGGGDEPAEQASSTADR